MKYLKMIKYEKYILDMIFDYKVGIENATKRQFDTGDISDSGSGQADAGHSFNLQVDTHAAELTARF